MKTLFLFIIASLSLSMFAQSPLEENYDARLTKALSSFLSHDDHIQPDLTRISEQVHEAYIQQTYVFHSQKWPITEIVEIPSTIWKHKLVLYIPKQRTYDTVLLYVNGGSIRDKKGAETPFQEPVDSLDYAKIALQSQAIVAELQDVPNQHLSMNQQWKREDHYMAYTYKKVMEDPVKNGHLAGHLPMAKSIIKAMDRIQELLSQNFQITETRFVLSGASKRAWALWLANLEDERVDALIPIVLDVLNVQRVLLHICNVHKGCPHAMQAYREADVLKHIGTPAFSALVSIEDPFLYLREGYDPKYKTRMAIPKLLIQASGDDFFVPDSSHYYFAQLPGTKNYIRYLPNSMHYFKGNPISESTESFANIQAGVTNYFQLHLKKIQTPTLTWKFKDTQIHLSSSVKPRKAVLWTAFNTRNQDFRFNNDYSTSHMLLKKFYTYLGENLRSYLGIKLCDTCFEEKVLDLNCANDQPCSWSVQTLSPPQDAWRASFVEVHYELEGIPFIISSEVLVDYAELKKSS